MAVTLGAYDSASLDRACRSPGVSQLIQAAMAGADPALTANTAISTAGDGTLTAAAIVGGIVTRSGPTGAYTDTTTTAALIYAAIGNAAAIGQSWFLTIKNTVNFADTLAAGNGVTLSGLTVVPPLSVSTFLVTLTSATAVSIVGIATQPLCNLSYSKFTSSSASNATATAGDITGAAFVNLTLTANGTNAYTTRTAAQMFADTPNAQVGFSYMLRIRNTGNNTVTVTAADASVTLTGTMTLATTTARLFSVTFTSAVAVTIQDLGVN